MCRKPDRLIRISGLLDSSNTQSVSHTTFGGVGFGGGDVGAGLGQAITESQGTTVLAKRFAIPQPPIRAGCFLFPTVWLTFGLVGWIMGWIVGTATGDPEVSNAVTGVAVFYGFVVAGLLYLPLLKFHRNRSMIEQDVANDVKAGYYCQRDDVAFSRESSDAATPEAFVDSCFMTHLPRLTAEIDSVPLMKHLPSAKRISAGDIRWTPQVDPLA